MCSYYAKEQPFNLRSFYLNKFEIEFKFKRVGNQILELFFEIKTLWSANLHDIMKNHFPVSWPIVVLIWRFLWVANANNMLMYLLFSRNL